MNPLRALYALAIAFLLGACAAPTVSETTAQNGPDKVSCGQERPTGSNIAVPKCRSTE